MTSKNMTIIKGYTELLPDLSVLTHFEILYNSGSIPHVDVRKYRIVFTLSTGEQIEHDLSEYFLELDIVYLLQFGISLTDDGKYFFIQSWEKGLYCFEVKSGRLVWHKKEKQVTKIVIHNNFVIYRCGRCVSGAILDSGEPVYRYPLAEEADFIPIADDRFLVGPKRKNYLILNENLQEVTKIPVAIMNPNDLDSFIIQNAELVNGNLRITGTEYSTKLQLQSRRSGSHISQECCGKFEREIPLDAVE